MSKFICASTFVRSLSCACTYFHVCLCMCVFASIHSCTCTSKLTLVQVNLWQYLCASKLCQYKFASAADVKPAMLKWMYSRQNFILTGNAPALLKFGLVLKSNGFIHAVIHSLIGPSKTLLARFELKLGEDENLINSTSNRTVNITSGARVNEIEYQLHACKYRLGLLCGKSIIFSSSSLLHNRFRRISTCGIRHFQNSDKLLENALLPKFDFIYYIIMPAYRAKLKNSLRRQACGVDRLMPCYAVRMQPLHCTDKKYIERLINAQDTFNKIHAFNNWVPVSA